MVFAVEVLERFSVNCFMFTERIGSFFAGCIFSNHEWTRMDTNGHEWTRIWIRDSFAWLEVVDRQECLSSVAEIKKEEAK